MKITKKKALALLFRAVREKGLNHRVSQCYYYGPHDNAPKCIVGHALAYEGVDLPRVLGGVNGDRFASIVGRLKTAGVEFTPGAVNVLNLAQQAQDGHSTKYDSTWGDAYQAALDAAVEDKEA